MPYAAQLFDVISKAGVISFFPVIAPQGTALPYAVWQEISSIPETTHDAGPAGLDDVLIQITCIGSTNSEAIDLRKTIRAAIDGVVLSDGSHVIIENGNQRFEQPIDAPMAILEVRLFTNQLA